MRSLDGLWVTILADSAGHTRTFDLAPRHFPRPQLEPSPATLGR
jgi:hypothetical protein